MSDWIAAIIVSLTLIALIFVIALAASNDPRRPNL